MKLSIILPTYNVSQYIVKCIRSIENQDISKEEYELIFIDDESPDSSVEIIKEQQKIYPNIRLVSKKNGGASSARNYGIQYATGDYIWFFAPDDYIEHNVLKRLLDEAYDKKLDLLSFNIYSVFDNGYEEIGFNPEFQPTSIISGETYIRDYELGCSLWFYIVKKNIIVNNNLTFTDGIRFDDTEFTLRLFKYINRMTFCNIRVYNYVGRIGSITKTINEKQILHMIHSWQYIIDNESKIFGDNSPYSKAATIWVNNHKVNGLCVLLFNRLSFPTKKEEYNRFKEIGAFKIGKTKFYDKKHKVLSRVMRYSWIYYILMHLYRIKK